MANLFVDLPLRLDDTAASPLRGRVAFVVAPDDRDAPHKSLIGRPRIAVPEGPSDLFARGLEPLFRNYVVGREVRTGVAALCDDTTFLRALRALADTVYAAALDRHDADLVVDASPSNVSVAELIRALYPEAVVVANAADAAALAANLPPRRVAQPPFGDAPALAAPPVLVVGVPRSGTTWLQHMLGAHPAIGGPEHETAIFVRFRALLDNVARPPADGLAGWIDRPALLAAMRRFAETLFAGYLADAAPGASVFLDKTPLHATQLALINEVFPDARIVSITRDGRDVVQSLLEMDAATDDVVIAATKWAEITRGVADALPALPYGRDERYEDLLARPVERVTDILRWLGLDVDAAVSGEIARRAGIRVSQYNTTGDVGSGKWRTLSARNLRAVYRFAGDRLVEAGYISDADLRRVRRRPVYRVEDAMRRLRRGA